MKKLTVAMIRAAVKKLRKLEIKDLKGWKVLFGPCPACGFKYPHESPEKGK